MYLDDFIEDSTVYLQFTTNDANGGAVAPSSAFEAADLKIYKDNGAAEKTTTNGITMTSPFDGVTGLHAVSIDTSNDTGDVGFWVTGSDYIVLLNPDTETVDGQTVVKVLAHFSIENRFNAMVDQVIEGTLTFQDVLKLMLSALANKSSGGGTTELKFRDLADTKERITATVDVNGNRTDTTLDAT